MFYAESIGMPNSFPAIPCSLRAIKSRHVEDCLREKSEANNTEKPDNVFMGENVSRRLVINCALLTFQFSNLGAIHSFSCFWQRCIHFYLF